MKKTIRILLNMNVVRSKSKEIKVMESELSPGCWDEARRLLATNLGVI
jgi:hypothetical protein